jgi:hypothetical protein
MTGRQPVVARLVRAGYRFGIPGIPLLLLVGLVLFLVAVASSNIHGSLADYWFLVAIGWLSIFFVFVIIGVLAGYWLPRIVLLRRDQGRYLPEVDDWLPAYAGILPAVGFTALIIDGSGAPIWLYVLGAASVVIGLAAFVDTLQLGQRLKKQQGRRRG